MHDSRNSRKCTKIWVWNQVKNLANCLNQMISRHWMANQCMSSDLWGGRGNENCPLAYLEKRISGHSTEKGNIGGTQQYSLIEDGVGIPRRLVIRYRVEYWRRELHRECWVLQNSVESSDVYWSVDAYKGTTWGQGKIVPKIGGQS